MTTETTFEQRLRQLEHNQELDNQRLNNLAARVMEPNNPLTTLQQKVEALETKVEALEHRVFDIEITKGAYNEKNTKTMLGSIRSDMDQAITFLKLRLERLEFAEKVKLRRVDKMHVDFYDMMKKKERDEDDGDDDGEDEK
jgi:uncharacterized coiled-coil protein SlyX